MSTDDTNVIDAYGAGTTDVRDLTNGGDYPMIVENGESPKRTRDKRELADRAKKRVA
jgi:hypothetical protein